MSQKLPLNGFTWYNDYLSDFNEEFIKNYDEKRVEYPKTLWGSRKELPFLPERRKLGKNRKTCL